MTPEVNNLFYLVRRGTNVRVLTKDGEPLIVSDESFLDTELERYEGFLRLQEGDLEAMPVQQYLETFWLPIKNYKEARSGGRVVETQPSN